jgi:hypothetical protein
MAGKLNQSAANESASEGEEIEEYVPPEIEDRGSLNEVTQGGTRSGNLDANYNQGGDSQGWGGGLFS